MVDCRTETEEWSVAPVKDSRGIEFPEARRNRIVSLVPSLTETLFAIGLADAVAGRTDWCIHPAPAVSAIASVGGTKTVRLDAIIALEPDLVIANREENRKETVAQIESHVPVFVTYPRSVREAASVCHDLGRLLKAPRGLELATEIQSAATSAAPPRSSVSHRALTLVWRDPFIAAGPDTYVSDVLACIGFENVLTDTRVRYPRISEDEIRRLAPTLILLPDEPYRFTEADAKELEAAIGVRGIVFDGTLTSWFGARTRLALSRLPAILSS